MQRLSTALGCPSPSADPQEANAGRDNPNEIHDVFDAYRGYDPAPRGLPKP